MIVIFVQCIICRSEQSICSSFWNCSLSMIQKNKFKSTKILYNWFSQFSWLKTKINLMTFLLIVCQFCIINLLYQIWLTHLKVNLIYDCKCSCFLSVAVQKSDSRCFFITNMLKLSKAVEWFIILWQIMHKILNNSSTIKVNYIKWFHILNCLLSLTFLNQSELTIFFKSCFKYSQQQRFEIIMIEKSHLYLKFIEHTCYSFLSWAVKNSDEFCSSLLV